MPRTPRLQHVVFAEPHRHRRVVNLGPRTPDAPPASARDAQHGDGDAFLRWLFRQASLEAASYRPETLRRRLPACLRALRASSFPEARLLLQADPSRIPAALSAIVIGVTSFFRDAPVFDHLTFTVLRDLRSRSRTPRIWSAGCSDGEELYSVAILLAEMNFDRDACLLGTDCRARAVTRARAGRYSASATEDVPPEWREKYFTHAGEDWQIHLELRQAAQWRVGDATRMIEPGGWDLILCRNFAMYLRPEVSSRMWEQMEQALRPGGYLILGKSERPIGAKRLSPVAPCIYRRDRM